MDTAPPTPLRNPRMMKTIHREGKTDLKATPDTLSSVDTDSQEAARPWSYVDVAPLEGIQLESHPLGKDLNLTAAESVSDQQDDDIIIIDNMLYEKLP